jgi:hypothetical protein
MNINCNTDYDYIENLAIFIKRNKLQDIAILLLESHRPLANLCSHLMIFAEPFLLPFFRIDNIFKLRELLRSDQAISLLISRIEQTSLESV